MMTRRSALMAATAAAAMGIGAPANAATAPAPAPVPGPAPQLPRHKVELVSPPFAHAHEQVSRHGPRIMEFTHDRSRRKKSSSTKRARSSRR